MRCVSAACCSVVHTPIFLRGRTTACLSLVAVRSPIWVKKTSPGFRSRPKACSLILMPIIAKSSRCTPGFTGIVRTSARSFTATRPTAQRSPSPSSPCPQFTNRCCAKACIPMCPSSLGRRAVRAPRKMEYSRHSTGPIRYRTAGQPWRTGDGRYA